MRPVWIFYSHLAIHILNVGAADVSHGEDCSSADNCQDTGTSCTTNSVSTTERCLCLAGHYWDAGSCKAVTDLKVSNARASRTTDTVTLTWLSIGNPSTATYTIRPSPYVGQLRGSVTSTTGTWTGLTAGTKYTFTITSQLPADNFYPAKSTQEVLSDVWTKIAYGDECTASDLPSDICDMSGSTCLTESTTKRCLCSSSYYYTGSACRYLGYLRVMNVRTERTTNTVTFTWSTTGNPSSVTYTIDSVTPNEGRQSGAVTSTGAKWIGLSPGKSYRFVIRSTLPASPYYSVKSSTASEYVWTKIAHGDNCTTSGLPSDVCELSGTTCTTNSASSTERCLCSDNYYYYASICTPVSDLAVDDVRAQSTPETVTLTWSSSGNPPSVTYEISVSSNEGQLRGSVTSTGGTWTGLSPSTRYTFSIRSTFPSVQYYPPRATTVSKDVSTADNVVTMKPSTSYRSSSNNWVYLRVNWSPGGYTGSTNYTIRVEEETAANSGIFREILSDIEIGHSRNSHTAPNVLAFWRYRVSVRAVTDKGNSDWAVPLVVLTARNYPGSVQHLTATQDAQEAEEFAITFDCPAEKDRNGTILGFTVRKKLMFPDGSLSEQSDYYFEAGPTSSCSKRISASDIGGVQVGRNYFISVSMKNQDYTGNFSNQVPINVLPKAPLLSKTLERYGVPALLRKPDNPVSHKTTIDVVVCASCLLDSRQGRVESVGLIVCKKRDNMCGLQGRKKRSDPLFEDYVSWHDAKTLDFNVAFRATPDNWSLTLNARDPSYHYIIGNSSGCDISQTTFCNGPLPANSEFIISVIKCNVVTCVMEDSGVVFDTIVKKDDESLYLKIGLGVAVGIIGILIIAFIIVIVVRYRRKKASLEQKQVRPYSALNMANQDSHLYEGVASTGTATSHATAENPYSNDGLQPNISADIQMAGLGLGRRSNVYSVVGNEGTAIDAADGSDVVGNPYTNSAVLAGILSSREGTSNQAFEDISEFDSTYQNMKSMNSEESCYANM